MSERLTEAAVNAGVPIIVRAFAGRIIDLEVRPIKAEDQKDSVSAQKDSLPQPQVGK